MKIVFITYVLSNGGAERVMSLLANQVSLKYNCLVILYYKTKDEYVLNEKVKKEYIHPFYKIKNESILDRIKNIRKIREIIKDYKPDYVIPFLNTPTIDSFFAIKFLKVKLITTIRINPRYKTKRLQNWIRDFILKKSYMIILQNKEQLDYFHSKIRKKSKILPNPVSDKFFLVRKDEIKIIKNLVTVGRLTCQKNHILLIKSVIELHKNYDITLSIYGEGEDKNRLENLIYEHKANEYIFLKGRSNDMPNTLNQYDMFILSSNYEGMPNALLEAMAVGLPCLSTDCQTGPKSIIKDGYNGLLCKTNSFSDMTNKIEKVICNIDLANKIASNARKTIKENYTEDKIISDFFSMIEL